MGAMIENVVIVEAVRSAVGRAHKGALAQTRPDELAGQVVAGLLARVPSVKPADVEELTARTFEKAWRARHRYRRDLSGFSTWLLTIARHVAIDYLSLIHI